jgi:hypothetical protein
MRPHFLSLHFLSASVFMPAAVVAADQFLLTKASDDRWAWQTTVIVLAWFVVQTGLLSYVAGLWLRNWRWRLLVLCWALLLINLMLWHATSQGRPINRVLTLAFLAGQVGALATYTILGTSRLLNRLALFVATAGMAIFLVLGVQMIVGGFQGDPWKTIVVVQSCGTCLLATLLRISRYRIEQAPEPTSRDVGPIQFSIRHLLIATTAVAILIAFVQNAPSFFRGKQEMQATVDGVVLALVTLAAFWSALGMGRGWVKLITFALVAIGAGAGLRWIELSVLHTPTSAFRVLPHRLTNAGWWWIAWTTLSGSFLGGLLLVLRATGFRLVRRR